MVAVVHSYISFDQWLVTSTVPFVLVTNILVCLYYIKMTTPSPSSAVDSFAANQRLSASISNYNVIPSGISIDVLARLESTNSLNGRASPAVKNTYSRILQSKKCCLTLPL